MLFKSINWFFVFHKISAIPQAISYLFQKQLLVYLFFPKFVFQYLSEVILQWLLAFHRNCLFQELTEYVLSKHVKVHACLASHSSCLSLDTKLRGLNSQQICPMDSLLGNCERKRFTFFRSELPYESICFIALAIGIHWLVTLFRCLKWDGKSLGLALIC